MIYVAIGMFAISALCVARAANIGDCDKDAALNAAALFALAGCVCLK